MTCTLLVLLVSSLSILFGCEAVADAIQSSNGEPSQLQQAAQTIANASGSEPIATIITATAGLVTAVGSYFVGRRNGRNGNGQH